VAFAHELLDAYPNAKVVLEYRVDVEAWHLSVRDKIERFATDMGAYD
jgi:hypothetical protein